MPHWSVLISSATRRWVVAGVILLASIAMPAAAQTGPACRTLDVQGRGITTFDAGDEFVVEGSGFGSRSLVLLSFQQGTLNAELTRIETTDRGSFTTSARNLTVPEDVDSGPAAIRALDGTGTASCGISIGEAGDEGGVPVVLYAVWIVVLVAFGAFLGIVRYRRWRTKRLAEAMEEMEWQEEQPDLELYLSELRTEDAKSTDAATPQAPLLDDDEDDEEEADEEEEHEAPMFPIVELDPEPEPDEDTQTFDWRSTDPIVAAEDAEPEVVPFRGSEPLTEEIEETTEVDEVDNTRLTEPPRLPEGWDEGKIRVSRKKSSTVSRLQDEVKAWKRQ